MLRHHPLLRRCLSSSTNAIVQSCLDSTTGVATITLHHPAKRNALSSEMLAALGSEVDNVTSNKHTKVIIVKSSHPVVFSSGHDLNELVPNAKKPDAQEPDASGHSGESRLPPPPNNESLTENHIHLFNLCSQVMLKVHNAPQPVIAEINGIATAAGCQLVASCDLAVASEDSQFATPGVNIGLFCSTPAVPLARTLAPKHAMEMLLTGDMITAHRAAEIGLINRVVEKNNLSTHVMALAEQIAMKSRSAIRMGKQTFRKQVTMNVEDAYALTGTTMVDNMGTVDAKEGISAFLQKRIPVWHDE